MANPLTRIFKRREPTRGRKSDRLTPDGLPITEFPPAVTRVLRLYGAGGSYAHIYATQPNVRSVVDKIAREAADLQLKLYMTNPSAPGDPLTALEIHDHRLIDLLDEPTPGESTWWFWFATFADMLVNDRFVWWKIRAGKPLPQALLRVPPANVTPEREPVTNRIIRWRTSDGTVIPNKDLVVGWGYDPAMNNASISPMETLRRLLAEEHAAGLDREGRWQNSARKDGVIEQHVEAHNFENDESREDFLIDIDDALSGAQGSGRPLLLEPGMSWNDVQWSPKEMEYIAGRKLNRAEVATAFHMPLKMAGASESDIDEETLNVFYTSTLPPYLSRVESIIHAKLMPEFIIDRKARRHYFVNFDLLGKLRGSFEKQAAILATSAGGPVLTLNEARARLNLPPVPGGDSVLVPMNSLRGGGPQVSPQNPTDTPTPGVEPVGVTPGGTSPGVIDVSKAETIEDILKKSDDLVRQRKARDSHVNYLQQARGKWDEVSKNTVLKFFERQSRVSKAGKNLKLERWDRELADDLFGLLYPMIGAVGEDASERVDGEFDHELTANFVREHSKRVAENVNAKTEELLEKSRGTKDDGEDDLDPVYGEGRAEELGASLTTFGLAWSVMEAGRQRGERGLVKTWFATSKVPRPSHASNNGSSALMPEEFGNGQLYPGDGTMGPEENANCRCIMTLESR